MGKVHGSLARAGTLSLFLDARCTRSLTLAGKVKSQTPKVRLPTTPADRPNDD